MIPAASRACLPGVVVLLLSGVGCGGGTKPGNQLAWVAGGPQLYAPRDLPRDRIVVGAVRNRSSSTVRVLATDVRVRDARGNLLDSSAGFTASYAHGLFGAFQKPSALPTKELVRLGRLLILEPGAKSPLFASWRLPAGAREPVMIDYGSGRLAVPIASRPAVP